MIYDVLLKEQFDKINKNNIFNIKLQNNKKNKNNNLSKGDKIKLESSLNKFKIMKKDNKSIIIIEFLMMELLKSLSKILIKEDEPENHKSYSISLYNLYKYNDFFNEDLNQVFKQNVEVVLQQFIQNLSYKKVLKSVSKYVEHNELIILNILNSINIKKIFMIFLKAIMNPSLFGIVLLRHLEKH